MLSTSSFNNNPSCLFMKSVSWKLEYKNIIQKNVYEMTNEIFSRYKMMNYLHSHVMLVGMLLQDSDDLTN